MLLYCARCSVVPSIYRSGSVRRGGYFEVWVISLTRLVSLVLLFALYKALRPTVILRASTPVSIQVPKQVEFRCVDCFSLFLLSGWQWLDWRSQAVVERQHGEPGSALTPSDTTHKLAPEVASASGANNSCKPVTRGIALKFRCTCSFKH